MKTNFILVLLFVLTVASAFGQTKTIFFQKDGKIQKEVSLPTEKETKDTLLVVSADLTGYPGSYSQQLKALSNQGEKVIVSTKDTIIYSKFGTKAYKYEKEVWITSNDGQSLQTYNDLAPRGQRTAWELLLLYVYMLLSYYIIGRYKKLRKNYKGVLDLVLGFGVTLGFVLVLGFGVTLGFVLGVGIALVLALVLVLMLSVGVGVGLILGFALEVGLVLGLVVGVGLALGLWCIFSICILLAILGYILGYYTTKKK